ncbi:MAG: hypothetical protein MUF34_30410 [Polyangiaceae bacterium]|nr:hypothetical protein [Polyangiaceae bacterium]
MSDERAVRLDLAARAAVAGAPGRRARSGARKAVFGAAGRRARSGARGALFALGALWALLLTAPGAWAAPAELSVETVVLGLEAETMNESAARALTNALRQQVLASEDSALRGESPPLVVKAGEARCPLKRLRRPLREASDRVFDAPCLRRLGTLLGARRFFWGHLYNDAGRAIIKLHLWREDEPDRVATLPYETGAQDRLAERLFRKLSSPDKMGDVAITTRTPLEGDLYVDGKLVGVFGPRNELTLPGGEHAFEVRRGSKVVARAKTRVVEHRTTEVRLDAVVEAPPPRTAPRVVEVRPAAASGRAVWPWVAGGVGVAGLVGAGAFFALYRGEQGDLGDACAPDKSCRGQQETIDRSKLYSTLSLVSLGVGVGAGAGAYFLWRASRREPSSALATPPVWVGLAPLGHGGAAAFAIGRF